MIYCLLAMDKSRVDAELCRDTFFQCGEFVYIACTMATVAYVLVRKSVQLLVLKHATKHRRTQWRNKNNRHIGRLLLRCAPVHDTRFRPDCNTSIQIILRNYIHSHAQYT